MMTVPVHPHGNDSKLRVVAVVQARLGSVRFPRKVLAPISNEPALGLLLRRLRRSALVDEVVLAVPESDAELVSFAHEMECRVWLGSEHDVLGRFFEAAIGAHADIVVRITGDCPLVDPSVVDAAVREFSRVGDGYVRTDDSYPDGFDVEVCSFDALRDANELATDPYDREHVMPWVRRTSSAASRTIGRGLPSTLRVTLDEPMDLEVIHNVVAHFDNDLFDVEDVVSLAEHHPELFRANSGLKRDEGATMSQGEKLWKRAQTLIPGGNMLLSKRSEQFLPSGWPAYFSRAKGCEVWDLDGRHFFDMSLMGVGTNILGYGHPKVDEAVRRTIDAGNLSTLNCPEEVELAERLCELHPWADMAKFARSGGEACAIAVRISRAASGKPAVAICGYHGWHDWYLSANLADDEALDGHLLPGLTPNGVPRQLQGLTRPFFYNDLDALREILSAGDVGAVFMEVERSTPPAPGFLEGVRALTKAHGCVLIFDECTSGFRQNLGGLHMVHGVYPDIATFGKTLGNGYAITAVIGSREVMSSAESTFISSTFWTERIGPSAALATLKAMAREDAPARIFAVGQEVRRIWAEVFDSIGKELQVTGLPALSSFAVKGWEPKITKRTLFQGMLDQGFLGGPALYASIAHDHEILTKYQAALSAVASEMANRSELPEGGSADLGAPTQGFGRLA